jgi:predicted N-formylglutamate amidohydrolase
MLSSADPPPVEIVNPAGLSRLLITGDHAGNAVPKNLDGLSLPPGELQRHIAWDIGVAEVARRLSVRMGATAVLASYSRLVIDSNRSLGDPGLIPAASDGTPIAPNQNLSDAARDARIEALYWPYHKAVEHHVARLQRTGIVPVVLALHSFTPALNVGAKPRPWHAGILYNVDDRLARLLLTALQARGDLVVGDNEPYSGITHGYGLKVHGIAHGLPHVELEIRQDLIADAKGQQHWADLLTQVLTPMLDHPDIKAIEHR